MKKYSKHIRKEIRALTAQAYENHLSSELDKLHQEFERWKSGRQSAWDVSDAIHHFYTGASRELFGLYKDNKFQDLVIARAIVQGFLSSEDLSQELSELLQSDIVSISENLKGTDD